MSSYPFKAFNQNLRGLVLFGTEIHEIADAVDNALTLVNHVTAFVSKIEFLSLSSNRNKYGGCSYQRLNRNPYLGNFPGLEQDGISGHMNELI